MAVGILEVLLLNAKGLGGTDLFSTFPFSFDGIRSNYTSWLQNWARIRYGFSGKGFPFAANEISQEIPFMIVISSVISSVICNQAQWFCVLMMADKIDPYVVIKYKSQEHKSSVARGEGGSPSWNEKFTFRAEYPGNSDQCSLTLIIMDKDTFSADDFIGKIAIPVGDLLALGVEKGTAQMRPTKYRVVRSDNSYCGEIQVGVSFNLKVEEECRGLEFGGWKQSEY
ncbi:hypothetical protein SAY86_030435 [Trapa natans]|uniref:C2 domain-containing protein n=1 Tax=Trapa natans TaxID=22666 RepID=A0AAN7RAL6_TRANT|nr:hypothetical protein SAY86_030435 [Trapa natans]